MGRCCSRLDDSSVGGAEESQDFRAIGRRDLRWSPFGVLLNSLRSDPSRPDRTVESRTGGPIRASPRGAWMLRIADDRGRRALDPAGSRTGPTGDSIDASRQGSSEPIPPCRASRDAREQRIGRPGHPLARHHPRPRTQHEAGGRFRIHAGHEGRDPAPVQGDVHLPDRRPGRGGETLRLQLWRGRDGDHHRPGPRLPGRTAPRHLAHDDERVHRATEDHVKPGGTGGPGVDHPHGGRSRPGVGPRSGGGPGRAGLHRGCGSAPPTGGRSPQ